MGLKYDPKFVEKLMKKNVLELSSTYQALMKEGKVLEAESWDELLAA